MYSRHLCKTITRPIKQTPSKFVKSPIYTAPQVQVFPDHVKVVDYRSDTFSKPSQQMRQVMFEAKVGDDVYGEDPTVNELEKKGAVMMGKEASLFVASGTMANLLAIANDVQSLSSVHLDILPGIDKRGFASIMTHSDRRGCEIIVGDESHILLWEQAGAAQIAGAQLRTVVNKSNGTFDLKEMEMKVRPTKGVKFLPRTSLVCVENTHNSCGGRVLPLAFLDQVSEMLKELNIPLHMDGARFFNSVVSMNIPAQEIVKGCDSINVCLSKGLGAPIGSLLIGSEEFIQKARNLRKVLGGGMRQVGLMAAAGIYALDNMVDRLKEDHKHAHTIAKAINDTGSKIVQVDMEAQETNILLINLDTTVVKSDEFCRRLYMVTDDELKSDTVTAVKILPWSPSIARLVVCCNNTMDDCDATINKMQRVIWEYDQKR